MKTGTVKPPRDEKPASHLIKAPAKQPDSLPIVLIHDAWPARPRRHPENLLCILRNRRN